MLPPRCSFCFCLSDVLLASSTRTMCRATHIGRNRWSHIVTSASILPSLSSLVTTLEKAHSSPCSGSLSLNSMSNVSVEFHIPTFAACIKELDRRHGTPGFVFAQVSAAFPMACASKTPPVWRSVSEIEGMRSVRTVRCVESMRSEPKEFHISQRPAMGDPPRGLSCIMRWV